jgi:hypothetical protein
MLKRLAVLCVFLGVSLAAASTLKMKFFDPESINCVGCSDPDGVATIHFAPGVGTKIHVTITGFAPDKSYGVWIGGLVDSGVVNGILTNPAGNGEVNLLNSGAPIFGDGPVTVRIYLNTFENPENPGHYDDGDLIVAEGIAD